MLKPDHLQRIEAHLFQAKEQVNQLSVSLVQQAAIVNRIGLSNEEPIRSHHHFRQEQAGLQGAAQTTGKGLEALKTHTVQRTKEQLSDLKTNMSMTKDCFLELKQGLAGIRREMTDLVQLLATDHQRIEQSIREPKE